MLDFIPRLYFEILGVVFGVFGCLIIFIQIKKEHLSKEASSLSKVYVLGWAIIYLFWALYGIKFKAIAVIITNGIATILQVILYIISFKKK